MLRLLTVCGLSLEDEHGPLTGAVTQRRRLAVPSILASVGERGISRDKLLAYLWPESDSVRRAVNRLLYAIRRDLRADALVVGSSEIRLNADGARPGGGAALPRLTHSARAWRSGS